MTDPRVQRKNPVIAAVLAYLIPGAGHLYQGRLFKAVLFFVCISGSFCYGMQLSEWNAAFMYEQSTDGTQRQRSWGYYAQCGMGIPAAACYIQAKRFESASNKRAQSLKEPLSSSFIGLWYEAPVEENTEPPIIQGQVQLVSAMTEFGPGVKGTFEGEVEYDDGSTKPVKLQLGNYYSLSKPISAFEHRSLRVDVVETKENQSVASVGEIHGNIPRPFFNRAFVPLDELNHERLHGELGRTFEVALVYTWIAGLLNVLAVWDAFEGPAYGYGDEDENKDSDPDAAAEDVPPNKPTKAEAEAKVSASGS